MAKKRKRDFKRDVCGFWYNSIVEEIYANSDDDEYSVGDYMY